MIGWTGLAPWEFECLFLGSLTYIILERETKLVLSNSYRESRAHVRQSGPDPGLGFEAKTLKTFQLFPLSDRIVLAELAVQG